MRQKTATIPFETAAFSLYPQRFSLLARLFLLQPATVEFKNRNFPLFAELLNHRTQWIALLVESLQQIWAEERGILLRFLILLPFLPFIMDKVELRQCLQSFLVGIKAISIPSISLPCGKLHRV